MTQFVTGEAVALELRPAKLPSRALAVLLDLFVSLTVYVVLMAAVGAATGSLDEAAQAAVAVGSFLLLLVGGPIAVETLSHGRSLGKLAFGLRVVRDDGGPIRFRHALVRGAMGVVEILGTFGVVAVIASLASARGRRIGDVFAGTLVVRERIPASRTGGLPPVPPWVGAQFAGADLSAVPEGLWLRVRQYLGRASQLDERISWSMARGLAVEVSGRVSVAVAAGMPPALYLAAMLRERQEQEARRVFGAQGVQGPNVVPGAPPAPSQGPYGSQVPVPGTGVPVPGAVLPPGAGASGAGTYAPPGAVGGPGEQRGQGEQRDQDRRPEGPASPPSTGFAPPS